MSAQEENVYFWSLRKRFLDSDDDMPDSEPKQVLYYSLAIGHHVGMIDCMTLQLKCPVSDYQDWINALPEGEARRKFLGLLKFGEIMIDSTHVPMLIPALAELKSHLAQAHQQKNETMLNLLRNIVEENALYLIAKKK